MPDRDLTERVGVLSVSPSWVKMPAPEMAAFRDRFLACPDWASMTDADKDLVRQGQLEVSAGKSTIVVDPAEWGDWDRIDAAVESGSLDELDAALATVGAPDGVSWADREANRDVTDPDLADLDGLDGLAPGDAPTETKSDDLGSDWVGL